jgi:hypothetical protein
VVNSVGVGNWRPATANFASDITVMDLAVTNAVKQSLGKQVLLYRLDMTSPSNGHGIYTGASATGRPAIRTARCRPARSTTPARSSWWRTR